jgi:CRISPR-associated endonuclease/helicase Cas3
LTELHSNSMILRFWGKSKPFHLLICHMIDSGCMIEALLTDSSFAHILLTLSEKFNIEKEVLLKQIRLATALHDIGKCHPLFQQKQMTIPVVQELERNELLQPGDRRVYRHEEFAQGWLRKFFITKYGWDTPPARLVGQVMACHHQKGQGTFSQTTIDKKVWWGQQQEFLAEQLDRLLPAPQIPISLCTHQDIAGTLLLSLVVLADWLASNPDFFPPVESVCNIANYYQKSRQHANEVITKLGFAQTKAYEKIPLEFSSIWPAIKPENMRSLQSVCQELVIKEEMHPGLLVIEAPMGEGKTEAALYMALQWMRLSARDGLYMALPTAATSNQMHGRVQSLIASLAGGNKVRLLHGMAWLIDDQTPVAGMNLDNDDEPGREAEAVEWFRPLKRGLLAPWAVGTIDQAMMAVLKVRYGVLRWAGLSGKILVLDEVHAYDAYMYTIIERLLIWCGVLGIPVIILSATLPSVLRQRLLEAYAGKPFANTNEYPEEDEYINAYPLITHMNADNIKYIPVPGVHIRRQVRLHIRSLLGQWDRVAVEAVEMVNAGGCLCIVVNTVKEAQILYREIKQVIEITQIKDIELKLFHARFKAGCRLEIENECLYCFDKGSISKPEQRPIKSILVATQVVEQSLDLDFDLMISAIAPIDLLLQRLGRLHRHEGRKRPSGLQEPVFQLLIPPNNGDFGPTGKVYEPWILQQTVRLLQDKEIINIPEEIRSLVEYVYSSEEPKDNHPYYLEWQKMMAKKDKERAEAAKYLIPPPDPYHFWMMRRGELTFAENEDGGKWFSAKTRLGDDTRRVIIISESQLREIGGRMKSLTRSEGKQLLKESVSLRSYILDGSIPVDDYLQPVKGEGLLVGYTILPLRDGEYRFVRDNKYEYRIVDDNELGILVERMK